MIVLHITKDLPKQQNRYSVASILNPSFFYLCLEIASCYLQFFIIKTHQSIPKKSALVSPDDQRPRSLSDHIKTTIRTKVKICGITSLRDAQMAIDMGADALGFNFYLHSSRYIHPVNAATIIAQLPKTVVTVGIFVNESLEQMLAIQKQTTIQMVQLHGDESLAYYQGISVPMIKAVRPHSMDELSNIIDMDSNIILLIDAPHKVHYGGSGELSNWSIAQQLTKNRDLILAGGLNANNVVAAVESVRPYMVDVCSGVERQPGEKSKEKMWAFFDALNNMGAM